MLATDKRFTWGEVKAAIDEHVSDDTVVRYIDIHVTMCGLNLDFEHNEDGSVIIEC